MYIVIAGNIGSGKTTLTEMLAHHYHWEPKYEQVTYNPYLEDYYKDIQRWSFPMEVFFLKERFRDLMEMQKSGKDTIQDRSIYEGVYVFATNNKRMGNLSDRDFDTFMELFRKCSPPCPQHPETWPRMRTNHTVGIPQRLERPLRRLYI